jgi:MFS family permease
MATQAAMGILSLALGILTVTGLVQLWMVYVFALLLGIVTVFDGPARNTFVNELVPFTHLSNAVALNATSFNTARVIGPALAGLLTAAIDIGPVFLINAASFAATIFALTVFRTDQLIPRAKHVGGRAKVSDGVRYVLARPDLRLLFLMIFIMGMLGVNFPLFISTMASSEFGQGATEFGVLSSVIAVGSVVGALLAARRERARLRYIVAAAAGFGISMLIAAIMPTYWAFGIVLPLAGITSITMLNTANAYVQSTTPSSLQGRVISLYMAVLQGGTPIGAPLIGAITNAYGPRWGIIVGALGGLCPALLALVWWVRRRRAAE